MPAKQGFYADIDSKILFLAKLGARYKGMPFNDFIEEAFRQALSREAMMSPEPNVSESRTPKVEQPLWHESLWHEDEAARLYNVGRLNTDLLTPAQRDIFLAALNDANAKGKKLTPKGVAGFLPKGGK